MDADGLEESDPVYSTSSGGATQLAAIRQGDWKYFLEVKQPRPDDPRARDLIKGNHSTTVISGMGSSGRISFPSQNGLPSRYSRMRAALP